MENQKTGDLFNVKYHTRDNIDYAFKNLVYYLNVSILYDGYKEYKKDFEKALEKVKNILKIYIEKGNLTSISEEVLQDVEYDILDLKVDTIQKLSLYSYYAEWSLLWIDALMSLRKSEIREGGIKDAG
jgi:hypothetical protein